MLLDLARALLAALLVGVGPGWFWSRVLYPGADVAGKVCLSVALSFALVPAVALIPASLFGLGVTLAVAVISALLVFSSGLAAYLVAGPSSEAKEPLAPAPEFAPATGTLVAFIAAFGLMLASYAGAPALWTLPALGLLLLAAVVDYYKEPRPRGGNGAASAETGNSEPRWAVRARRGVLALIVGLVLFRGYSGPVIHDWPFIRGVDQYSHAVMAQRMMTVGEISPYLIYPPGFHTITAAISRLSGMRPLEIFPVIAPVLLLLPVLALYALARRLWGPWCGVAAALLGGLAFTGSYHYFSDAMYPNMVAGQFLLVLAVAALLEVYARPSARSGALFVALGGSVVLFHQVASLYLALLLALVSVLVLPALLLKRERRRGLALLASLAGVGFLATLYAWETYDFGTVLAGGAEESETGGTLEAIRMAVGSQLPYLPRDLIGIILTQPLAWLGLFGAFMLVLRPAFARRTGVDLTRRLVSATLLLWLGVMVAGASTSYSGFPQRFARDLGMPLSLLGALAAVAVVAALVRRGPAAPLMLSLAVPLMATAVGLAVWVNLGEATTERTELTFTIGPTATPGISAAGDWLRANNEGGNIMVSPQANQVPSRMMLAMGGYSAMQSYTELNILYNRDLPPAGADAMRDVLWVMTNPEGPLTRGYIAEYDIRYIVLFKDLPDRGVVPYWTLFDDPGPPHATVFENSDVLIVEPRFSDEAPATE